ncbi:MAG: pentapeptide repeat-containing protein [Phormidesmis sp.]
MTAEELVERYSGGEWQFSGINLSGVTLRGIQLSGADLSGADLSGADLSGADLSGAILDEVNLSAATLQNAQGSFSYEGAFLCKTITPDGEYIEGPAWV